MLTWRERLRLICEFATPEVLEFKAGLSALLWGLWLLLPGDMFALYPPFFTAMTRIGPEWMWALAVAGTGLSQLIFTATPRWQFRRFLALHACAMWAFIATLYLLAEWRAPGVGLSVALSLSNGWIYYRLRRWDGANDAEGEAVEQ